MMVEILNGKGSIICKDRKSEKCTPDTTIVANLFFILWGIIFVPSCKSIDRTFSAMVLIYLYASTEN